MECKTKIGKEIAKINHIIKRNMDMAILEITENNLKSPQAFLIEFIIRQKDKDVFQKDIEKHFNINRSAVSLMLNNMEKNELIKRNSVNEDARLKKIILTDKALKLHEKIFEAISKTEEKMSKGISQEEIVIFNNVLSKIKKNLE